MIYPDNPNFEDEFEAEIQTKNARFRELKSKLSANNKFNARLAALNLEAAPFLPPTVPAGLGLIGKDITEVDPRLLDDIAKQVQSQDESIWDNVTDKLKGVTRGVFAAADAGLDFVKGQLLGRFPVEIGQRFNDKVGEGKSRTQALGEVFDEFSDIREKVGDTAFTMALREAMQGREINLGEGIIPRSTPITETDEYKELIARGIAPETALDLAEKMIGAPITEIAREQAVSGVTFRGETGAGLRQSGQGDFVTLGRLLAEPLVAMDVLEPGSNGYSNITGAADFVGTLALDPANWIALGAGAAAKSAKSIKYIDEQAKIDALSRTTRKRIFTVTPEGVATQAKEMGAIKGGIRKTVLERFPRLGGYSVEGLLDSEKGVNLTKFLSSSDDVASPAGNIDTLSSLLKTDDYETLGKIARSVGDESEMYDLLRFHFGANVGEKIPFSTRLFDSYKMSKGAKLTQRGFGKITGLGEEFAQFGVGPSFRHTNKWSPLVRSFSKLYDAGYDPTNLQQSFVTLRNMMRQMDLDPEDKARILKDFVDDVQGVTQQQSTDIVSIGNDLVKMRTGTDQALIRPRGVGEIADAELVESITSFDNANIIFKANSAAARAWTKTLAKDIDGEDADLAEQVIQKIGKFYDDDLGAAGLNFVDEQGGAFNLGESFKAYINDEVIDIPTYRLETELAQNYIPTIPPSSVVKGTNIFKKNILGRTPLKKFQKNLDLDDGTIEMMMDKYISGVWKPAVLLRGAWTIRVIGEEQVRLWAQGYDGLFSPSRWMAMMTGKPLDPTGTLKILKKLDDGVPDTQIENLIFEKFPDLPKRFAYKGEQIGIVEAIKRYMNSGDRDLLEIVNLTSDETQVMREFFDAISGTHRGYAGLRKTNPNMAAKGFSIFEKRGAGKGYVNAMQTEFDQLMNDSLAVKILEDGAQAAKEFLWSSRFTDGSIAKQISKQDPFFEQILTTQSFSDKIVDYVNARIHIKTGGKVNKETLEITTRGNDDLLQILRSGTYKDVSIKNMRTTEAARKQYKKIFDEYRNELPATFKGRGGTQYGEFAFESKFGQSYDKVVENMFYALMAFPTNKLSRAPVFKQAYWKKVSKLIGSSEAEVKAAIIARAKQANVSSKLIKEMEKTGFASYEKAIFKYTGKSTDEGYRNLNEAFDAIDEVAKANALTETKKLLYDLSERTRFWEATRLIFPFGEAFQEIGTTWAKILKDNPAPVRRFQLMVEKGRESNPFDVEDTDRGFFYQDPTTGEEMFAFPGWGGMASKWMGIQEDDPIQLEASGFAKSVNLIGQSFLPGVGPVVQLPASFLLRNAESDSAIVQAIFGDFAPPPVDNPIKYIYTSLPIPSWFNRVLQAYDVAPENYDRLQTNTTIDIYNALYYAGRVSDANYEEWSAGMDQAKEYAKTLTLIRAMAQFIGPTGFSPKFEVMTETPEGRKMILVSALAQDYRDTLDLNGGDQFKTTQEFINNYGIDPTGLLTGKSSQVFKRPVTVDGYKFYNNNKKLFDEYKSTAYFARPDESSDEFSYEAYLLSLQEKTRVPLNEEQWRYTRNNILGSIAWENFMLSSAPGRKPYWLRSDEQASTDKTLKKMSLKGQYPGWGTNVAGVPQKPELDTVIQEFYRWKDNTVLSESEAGKGLALYLKARDNAKLESERLGYSPNSFRSVRGLVNIRQYLEDYAEYTIQQYPDFQYIWNSYLKNELLDTEKDEQLRMIQGNY